MVAVVPPPGAGLRHGGLQPDRSVIAPAGGAERNASVKQWPISHEVPVTAALVATSYVGSMKHRTLLLGGV